MSQSQELEFGGFLPLERLPQEFLGKSNLRLYEITIHDTRPSDLVGTEADKLRARLVTDGSDLKTSVTSFMFDDQIIKENEPRYITGELIHGQREFGAAVYRVFDRNTCKILVAKRVSNRLMEDEDLHMLEQEARLLAYLKSKCDFFPNAFGLVVDSHEVTYMVMELIEGIDLLSLMARTPLNEDDAIKIAYQAATMYNFIAKEQNIFIRDIKPENIMLDYHTGRLKLLDVGISSPIYKFDAPEVQYTPGYAAPEVIIGKAVPESDYFSFGTVLREIAQNIQNADAKAALLELADLMTDKNPQNRVTFEGSLDYIKKMAERHNVHADEPIQHPGIDLRHPQASIETVKSIF